MDIKMLRSSSLCKILLPQVVVICLLSTSFHGLPALDNAEVLASAIDTTALKLHLEGPHQTESSGLQAPCPKCGCYPSEELANQLLH
ncbi:hypothetical protein CROQUDRAFT_85664 [Cronartium quercuum f. sp. fusiforme G11]|uniref:Secreted protein n=1 Tax=Cronartium quercuum f. sp. fusiforme G11 TaxID=708437 RepID=A0A9P6NSC5_9BASI|nr:hypothetical protein CROQUDRAFT_85664 [Cronartium quercuum f. sp. fusiforme G11]